MKKTVAVAICFLLFGCGPKLSGTYSQDLPYGKTSYAFGSNGKVMIDNGRFGKMELPYEVDGKNLKLISDKGNAILTLVDDKTIEGPMGLKLIKEK